MSELEERKRVINQSALTHTDFEHMTIHAGKPTYCRCTTTRTRTITQTPTLGGDHQIDLVDTLQTALEHAQQCVRVGGQIYPHNSPLQIHHVVDEHRVLVRVAFFAQILKKLQKKYNTQFKTCIILN